MKYHLLKDKGEGTAIQESPQSPFDNLMEAVDNLIGERAYILEDVSLRWTEFKDGKYYILRTIVTEFEITPEKKATYNGEEFDRGFFSIRHPNSVIARLWLEASET